MRSLLLGAALLSCLSSPFCTADSNISDPLSSKQILPSNFKPPTVFKNVNLLRTINLEKAFVRETVNVVIENIASEPQNEYFLPFEADVMSRVGGLEVRDKNEPEKGALEVEAAEYDTYSPTQFYLIRLPSPLAPKQQQTLSINYAVLSAFDPLPATIQQTEKQYLKYDFSVYSPSVYKTEKQKTKLKFPSGDVPDYTILPSKNAEGKEDPQRQGSTFSYGPFGAVEAGAVEAATVRYEFTKPLTHASLLERDVEVSHWGGNLATEERYWLVNQGAKLANHFSRVAWAASNYNPHFSPPTSSLKEMRVPLQVGATDAYFIDDIGNVSTSRFRSNSREALLELKPRYPIFGGWKYSFRIGWNANLDKYLRRLATGEQYVLKVPFLEGPKQPEGIEYERVELRVILPEGATDVKFSTAVPITSSSVSTHRTFMDTLGRTTLSLTAVNVVDDARDAEVVVTYTYPWSANFRKPITIFAAMLTVFTVAWVVGSVDTSIGGKKS